MTGKPFQSILIQYQKEIAELRGRKPPVSYAQISELLRQKYGLSIRRGAIAKFVKRRSGGRKVYYFRREVEAKKPAVKPTPKIGQPGVKQPLANPKAEAQPSEPKFEFTYSERYNLKRLPPEEAAAIRKKLEAEGH